MASDDPVLPPVNSTTRMPGRSAPRASAPSIIASAMRSLYEPVGFADSSLTTTSAAASGTARRRRTTGVRPIALNTESATETVGMVRSLSRVSRVGWVTSVGCGRGDGLVLQAGFDYVPIKDL